MSTLTRRLIVDLTVLSLNAARLTLHGLCANPGAVTGRLRIIDDPNRFDLVERGDLVVVSFTNNSWNPATRLMIALIAEKGNLLSHPAANARECGIPGLVNCRGARELLRPLDGEIVTFDATLGLVIAGCVPLREVETPLEMWVSPEEIGTLAERDAADTRELTSEEQWERLKEFGQTMEDSEGRFLGKPKRSYGYFQLGYYIRGWKILDARLNGLLGGTSTIRHPPIVVKGRVLYFRVESGASYLRPLELCLREEDLAQLVRTRREAFLHGEHFFTRPDCLGTGNARAFGSLMTELLSHMHFAYFLCCLIENRVRPHLLDVRPEAQPLLYDLALRHDTTLTAGERHSVVREKSIATDALLASIADDPQLLELFQSEPTKALYNALQSRNPAFLDRVLKHEASYKFGSEDLRLRSNLDACLAHLRGAASPDWRLTLEQLAAYCTDFAPPGARTTPVEIREAVCRTSPDLARLVEYTARKMGRSEEQVLAEVQRHHAGLDALAALFRSYPNMHRLASLARQAAMLRDDAHELIARWQRLARDRMLRVGEEARRNGLLDDGTDVFDLDLEEFLALAEDMPRAGCVRLTASRREELDAAERRLASAWATGPAGALERYQADLRQVRECLTRQAVLAGSAGHVETAEAYRAELAQLANRAAELRIRVGGV